MKDTKMKQSIIKIIVGSILLLLAAVLIGVGGLADWIPGGAVTQGGAKLGYGVRTTIAIYAGAFSGNFNSKWSFVVLLVDLVVIACAIFAIIKAIRHHQYPMIYCIVAISLGFAFLPFLIILAYRLMQVGKATVGALWVIAISFILLLAGIVLVATSGAKAAKQIEESKKEKPAIMESLSEDQIRIIVREEIEKHEAEKPVKEEIKPLTKEEIEEISKEVAQVIVDKAIEEHVEEKHVAPVEEEVKEEPVAQETPVEEETEEVEEDDDADEEEATEETTSEEANVVPDETDPFGKLKNKRRANFETRLKNSEFDLRHKYYDLRDHIKSYGLKNRISIPGDSFSAHRKRYVFLTINGKHIKAYFASNPDDYKDSSIPVERTTAKKYEDLPLCFKVRSNLSFKRAIKLVDDMLTKEGYVREDKPIKNTQNPEQK